MKRFMRKLVVLLFISIAAEIFVFNFKSWSSFLNQPIENFKLSYSPGSSAVENEISFPAPGTEGAESGYIEISDINVELNNIYIDIRTETADPTLDIVLMARDSGSDVYYEMPMLTVAEGDRDSHYIKLNLNGEAKSLRICFPNIGEQKLLIKNIALNVHRPIMVSFKHIAFLFVVLLAIYIIRPGSEIYKTEYSLKIKVQRGLIMLLLLAQVIGASYISMRKPEYVHPEWEHHYQYHKLAVALTEGHFYLDDVPSEQLKAMENPYDYLKRDADGVPYIWDQAYYQGKYYVYFGILPVLTFYLPFYLLTGQAFPTYLGIIITLAAIIIGIFFLLNAVVRKYFKHVSLGAFMVMDFLVFMGCGGLVIAGNAIFYSLPVAMAIALTMWGLYFWITALKGENQMVRWRLVIGSLLMALVAASRPQLLVGSFFAIPLFWGYLRNGLRTKGEGRKHTVVSFLAFAIPYIIVAALLMYYNYARFGSPFDFGANYNITTNDMTSRGFHVDRLPLGTYMYLLQPPSFNTRFPFLFSAPFMPKYQGITIFEGMYGGILWFNPLMFVCAGCISFRGKLKERRLYVPVVMSVALALIVMCVDIEMAGLLMRYFCDFGMFLVLPAVLIYLSLLESARDNTALYGIYHKLLFGITLVTAAMGFLWVLAI